MNTPNTDKTAADARHSSPTSGSGRPETCIGMGGDRLRKIHPKRMFNTGDMILTQFGQGHEIIGFHRDGVAVNNPLGMLETMSWNRVYQHYEYDNEVSPLPDDVLAEMNPGIRETVQWLRSHGFDTRDSGDGKTKEHECDPGVPYVHIVTDAHRLASEAERLATLLRERGVKVQSMDEDGTAIAIEAGFDPVDGVASITLWNCVLDQNDQAVSDELRLQQHVNEDAQALVDAILRGERPDAYCGYDREGQATNYRDKLKWSLHELNKANAKHTDPGKGADE